VQITNLDSTISDARRTLAHILATGHQVREVMHPITAIKCKVDHKERAMCQECYTKDAKLNHSCLNTRLGLPQKTIAAMKPSDKKFNKKSFRPQCPSKLDRLQGRRPQMLDNCPQRPFQPQQGNFRNERLTRPRAHNGQTNQNRWQDPPTRDHCQLPDAGN
jgi:hypothetical protein